MVGTLIGVWITVRDGNRVKKAMAAGLHASVDGSGLEGSRACGYVYSWMASRTAHMSGNGYVNCIRLKGNLPYTKARAARGRPDKPTRCDACHDIETLGHIL